jgi:hypothetical protein
MATTGKNRNDTPIHFVTQPSHVKQHYSPEFVFYLMEKEQPLSPMGGSQIKMDPQEIVEGQETQREIMMVEAMTRMRFATRNNTLRRAQ